MRFSMTAIVVVVVVAIVLFGAKRLPELARSLGQSMRILKSEAKAMRTDGEPDGAAPPAPAQVDSAPGKTIQAAPGASATARPVAEPGSDRPH
ncbi:Sec-independent protein translocase subunit TatA [Kitasatospora aureofaciens]|uniref:Sec-independent protein translocase subunit TatA n=1 Tax=Kitasatospora aureofaciens TaxID=1894 RepID=UPI0005274022|nr:Sec-independent protein translocase subunit TatA [Kitasatospora aureofaciens]HJD85535.1 Sec-independent protein translocase subunit TatA [Kitasatospora aureofaciens]